jgi:hypothetical protein
MNIPTHKNCTLCKLNLEIHQFTLTKKGKYKSGCKKCVYEKYYRPSILKKLRARGGVPKAERVLLTPEERRLRGNEYLRAYKKRKRLERPPKAPKVPKPAKVKPVKIKPTKEELAARKRAARAAYYAKYPERKKAERARHLQNRKSDPVWRIRKNLRKRLKELLSKGTKIGPYNEMIGCTAFELRAHLESQFKDGMTWENYGTAWHVDHIRPLCSFDVTDKSQKLAANNFKNLQPLFAEDNLKKGGKWEGDS